ncbi:MAG: TadE/TadG family type IV pilus assembly protein [Maioricimonas sp. JB049]
MISRPDRRRSTVDRSGVAMVELAVCLPTLLMILLTGIQAADMIFLKQTLQIASYESSRAAIRRKGTNALAEEAAAAILDGRGVNGYAIAFDPQNIASVERGNVICVTVSAAADANTVLPGWLPLAQNMSVSTRMVKE